MRFALVIPTLITCVLAYPGRQKDSPSASSKSNYPTVKPVGYSIGNEPTTATTPLGSQTIRLTPESPVLTLDFGQEIGGYAYIDVAQLDGPSQVEFKFAESYHGLAPSLGEGAWVYVNTLSNTFLTETASISHAGRVRTKILQGGFRWQTITLLPGSHAITISCSGIAVDLVRELHDPDSLPGQMSSSNTMFDEVFKLGARTLENSCFDAHSQPSTWQVTSDGVYLRGQTPALTAKGTQSEFDDLYTLEFDTKIDRGGVGWVAGTFQPSFLVEQAYFVMTGDYPANTTFTNTNQSLVPPNTISFVLGYNLVNSSVSSGPVVHYKLPMDVHEHQWYHISTKLNNASWTISVDGQVAAEISLTDYQKLWPGSPTKIPTGSFGFGPFRDQAAYYKNVKVTASNGTTIYTNSMTGKKQSPGDLLYEYGVHENTDSVCLDGPKRDRLVWTGDFTHTVRTLGTTTGRHDFSRGLFEFCFTRQGANGYVPISGPMGLAPDPIAPAGTLADYQILFLVSLYAYYEDTGDIDFMRKHWSGTKDVVTAVLQLYNPDTGLLDGALFNPGPGFTGPGVTFWLGPSNGTAISAVMCYALRQMSTLAAALGDHSTAFEYTSLADDITKAVQKLWSEELGTFALSTTGTDDYSVASIAFSILSGIATPDQENTSITVALPELFETFGYRDQFSVKPSPETWISPNTNGFLLEAVMQVASRHASDQNLATQFSKPVTMMMQGLWSQMAQRNENYTGAVWESLGFDGKPISLSMSLSHPWSSAPSYVLPEYVLGLRKTAPGWKTWTLTPFVYGLGLDRINAKRKTPYGEISASWQVKGKVVTVSVNAPAGTKGVVSIGRQEIHVNGGRSFKKDVHLG